LHIQDAIEFGKFADAILIEKPVTHRLLSEKELGVLSIYESKIAVSYPLRFAPAFNSVNAALKKVNEFERVTVTAKSDSRKWRKEDVNPNGYWLSAEEGGVLREFSHEIDYAISFFGQPQRILDRRISTSKLGPDSLPGEIVLDYRSEKCKKVSLDLSMDSEREVRYLQAFWNGGFLNWNILTGHVSLKNDNELVHFNHGSFNQLNSLKIQLLSLLRQKDMPSLCTFSQGIEIVKTIDLFSKEFDLIYDGRI
jgi:predicted dehydrogenase